MQVCKLNRLNTPGVSTRLSTLVKTGYTQRFAQLLSERKMLGDVVDSSSL